MSARARRQGPDTAFDVLVVGAGPTGLTLANILGLHGVRTLLVERNAATVSEPRAVSIDDESLRTMQYIGIVDEVRKTIVEGYGSYYYSPAGACFAKVVPEVIDYGFPRRSAFRQPVLEAQLRAGLARFPSVAVRFSTRVARLAETEAGVTATLASDTGTAEVHARFVVASDGGRSGIREALGIAMGGATYDQRWLIVDLMGSLDRFRHTRVYCDPARPALALPGPAGARRYEFMLLPGEDPEAMTDEAQVRALVARFSSEDAQLTIVRKVVYHFHARIAERWSSGRIFLAGDAAHLSPPFAGQGMNSGVRDAHNLGWKLAWCVRGLLGGSALRSYEIERKPHAAALVQMAVNMGRVMMPRSPANALLVQAAFRVLGLYRPARDYVMQMKYKPKPQFHVGLLAGTAGVALRGCMLAQPMVELPDGTRLPFDTVLGPGFVVVEIDDGTLPLAAPRAGRALEAGLLRVIPREQRFVALAGDDVVQVRDCTGVLGGLFARHQVRGAIVRPDRYVAACLAGGSDAGEADRMLEEIVQLSNAPAPDGTPGPRLDAAIA